MSQPPSASKQTGKDCRARTRHAAQAGSQRGGISKVYLHSVTDAQAAVLTERKCQEIQQKTGVNVELDLSRSDVQNTKSVIVRGCTLQIKEAVRLISHETGTQETLSAQAQTFWQQWVETAFPDLESRAYFLPPVYFNRVPITRQSAAGLEVLILHRKPGQAAQSTPGQGRQPTPKQTGCSNQNAIHPSNHLPQIQDSDVRDDAAMQRFLFCLQKMSEENGEILVGLSQLQFGQYLGEPCYAAAAAHLPVAKSLPAALPKNKRGDFDVLLIHRQYGIVVCEVKAFGDNVGEFNMSHQDMNKNIQTKLTNAVSQLDKADVMLSHLVSDVTPGLRIIKTIVVPNLTAPQVQQAISGDPRLLQDLCRCLGTTDPADITGLCVCSDQLSDPKTPWDVSSDVLRELGNWWQRRVAVSGLDKHMTSDNYATLVARFCGPATTVTVPCTSPPRLCVKTLGQAVSWTGECYTAQITLFPEQVHLLNTTHPRVFLAGPPGTGKTVVLLLKATEWLRCGNDVYIVSTIVESRAACSMLYHLLLQIIRTQLTSGVSHGHPHLLQYFFNIDEVKEESKEVQRAVKNLSLLARNQSLYVIAEDVCDEWRGSFQDFCEQLQERVPRLHVWASSYYRGFAPAGWHTETLTRPLRYPPAVLREVQQAEEFIEDFCIEGYSERSVADHTDGPPVRRLYHRGQGHLGDFPQECVTCGREVASFLHSLCVTAGSTTFTNVISPSDSSTTPPCLQWRDMLVLCSGDVGDQSGAVKALREANIPLRVMEDDEIEDVVTARSDVVWVVSGDRVRGVERKVVVCLDFVDYGSVRLNGMSRCTSQLVIVYG